VLLFLAIVPILVYWASGRDVYPSVNPESGGPTGVSLLVSTDTVVILMLVLPIIQGDAPWENHSLLPVSCWSVFVSRVLLVAIIGMDHASHREWQQWLSLGSLTLWIPLMPIYYRGFAWPKESKRWRMATLVWFGILTATGWFSFLPHVLDHLKFTDGLVAHSHLAMAGFVTSSISISLIC
jgi:cytochrome c oxidase cbb3-type subunit 1